MSIPYNQGSEFEDNNGEVGNIPPWQLVGKVMYRSLNAPLPLGNGNEVYPEFPTSPGYLPDGSNIPHEDPEGAFATRMEDLRNTQLSDAVQEEYAKFMAGTMERHYPQPAHPREMIESSASLHPGDNWGRNIRGMYPEVANDIDAFSTIDIETGNVINEKFPRENLSENNNINNINNNNNSASSSTSGINWITVGIISAIVIFVFLMIIVLVLVTKK